MANEGSHLAPERGRSVARQTLCAVAAWLMLASGGNAQPADAAIAAAGNSPLQHARQLLLVLTEDWDAVAGTLQQFERATATRAWAAVGAPIRVVVGRNGLAWGRGEHTPQPAGPIKKEGDGRAPAGAFRLSTAFGHNRQPPAGVRMPYLYLADNVECVDDERSVHYNEVLARVPAVRPDWASAEQMRSQPLYRWGIVVEHNTRPVVPGAGSCIFLHIWSRPDRGTAGCTAMAEADLMRLLLWLDAAQNPMLVQLPRGEHAGLARAWGLPPDRR